MYIHIETQQFPLYEGDIRLLYPNMGDFVLPEGYAEVTIDPQPPMNLEYHAQLMPPVFENGAWVCKWEVTKIPEEEMAEVLYNYRLQTDTAFYRNEMDKIIAASQGSENPINNPGAAPNVIG